MAHPEYWAECPTGTPPESVHVKKENEKFPQKVCPEKMTCLQRNP